MNISRKPYWNPLSKNPNKDHVQQVYRRTSLVCSPSNESFRPGEGTSLVDASRLQVSDQDKVEFLNGLVLSDQADSGVSVRLPNGEHYTSPGELEVNDHHVRIRFEIKDQTGRTENWEQGLDNNGSLTLRRDGESRRYISFKEDGTPGYTGDTMVVNRHGNAYLIEGERNSQVIVPPVPFEQFFA